MKSNEALDLLKYALHLRIHGENAPGGNETWKEFDTKCEAYLRKTESVGQISDGFHTFKDLYNHRRALTVALMESNLSISWKSKEHHPEDQPMFKGGYFIVGMTLPGEGQISYHYKLHHWTDFDNVTELPHAPKWNGHSPETTVIDLFNFKPKCACR